ncbi:MAG: SIMPL domain-containing protein [Deltaproteobacteria bacterium]|nr:SIMPL domain-containing protein [Deltaproteobacteria bacterium]
MTNVQRLFGILTMATVLLSGERAPGQELTARPTRNTIRVTGEANIAAKPDQAQLEIGVVTQAPTADAAAAQNARQLDAALSQLRAALGSAAEIRTIGYTITPNYRYPREGGTPTITGYTATNIVQVKINDLKLVGKAIDSSTQSGANRIQRLQFGLKDERPAQLEALREAAIKARGKAEAIAGALRVRIVRVFSAEETGAIVVPRPPYAVAELRAASPAPPTPVEPGTVDVRATVVLTLEIE